jgi:hypothetical protein
MKPHRLPRLRKLLDKKAAIPIFKIAAQWGERQWFVRHAMEQAGIKIFKAPVPPVDCVRLGDLLVLEEQFRQNEKDSYVAQNKLLREVIKEFN